MSGAAIAAEVAAALAEATGAVGNGAQASLIRSETQPVNPWDAPSGTTTTHAVWAVAELYRQDTVDGTLIRAEDLRVMLEPVTPAPTTADRLTIAGTEYAIVSVQTEAPAGVALYHICQCRT
jgi:phosphoglycolate phosphatase-like HAD superfamily hydrolase